MLKVANIKQEDPEELKKQANILIRTAKEIEKLRCEIPSKEELNILTEKIKELSIPKEFVILHNKLMLNIKFILHWDYSDVVFIEDIELVPLNNIARERNICEILNENMYLAEDLENIIKNHKEFKDLSIKVK